MPQIEGDLGLDQMLQRGSRSKFLLRLRELARRDARSETGPAFREEVQSPLSLEQMLKNAPESLEESSARLCLGQGGSSP